VPGEWKPYDQVIGDALARADKPRLRAFEHMLYRLGRGPQAAGRAAPLILVPLQPDAGARSRHPRQGPVRLTRWGCDDEGALRSGGGSTMIVR
jgi:hypothetical protein